MMSYPINYTGVNANTEFYDEVLLAHDEATAYIESFDWCEQIKGSSIYLNFGSVLCIFLFEIENSASSDDNYLWLIVGDIPPMYLDVHGPRSTKQVLDDYINLAQDWIDAINDVQSTDNCYPFDTEPTSEMALMLKIRIDFIRDTLMDSIEDIVIQK